MKEPMIECCSVTWWKKCNT